MRPVTCTSRVAAPLINAGERDGGALLFNSDLNNTVWLGKDPSIAANYDKAIPLSPQSWLALDGEDDIYGVCQTGQTVVVNVVDGGLSFFQSGITSGAFRIGPLGLFIYATQNPTFGTPPIFSATPPGVTADPFGNPVVANAVTTYNAFGAVINVLSMANGAFFQYQDNLSAVQGALILAISSNSGNDPVNGTFYPAGQFGVDPVFGDSIIVTGASITLQQLAYTEQALIAARTGSGAANPFVFLSAPEQGQSGHLVMLMQGTSPDGTQPGQLVIATEPTGNTLPTPATTALLENQGDFATGTLSALATASFNNSAVETVIGTFTLPKTDVRINSGYRMRFTGVVSTGAAAVNVTLRVRKNTATGTLLATSTAIAANAGLASALFTGDFSWYWTAVGAGGSYDFFGSFLHNFTGLGNGIMTGPIGAGRGAVGDDTTASRVIVVTAQFSAANVLNVAGTNAGSMERIAH